MTLVQKYNSQRQIIRSLLKALAATLFYALISGLYNLEIVRSKVEDVGFDIINKLAFNQIEHNSTSPNIMLFGIDDLYLKNKLLLDEANQTNYGYVFPRDKIAEFIENLDEFSQGVELKNRPKILFIDYDLSFSSAPYGALTPEDERLISALSKDRSYIIILSKTAPTNIIEQSKKEAIQKAIKDGKIVMASVGFLVSGDEGSRRYTAYQQFLKDGNKTDYINANVAIWQIINQSEVNIGRAKKEFKEKDVISNRIIIKNYKDAYADDACAFSKSYWSGYSKYSANCGFYDLDENEFANSIIILGGTSSDNSDKFKVLNYLYEDSLYGAEMHANALSSMFYFNGQMKSIRLAYGLFIIFIVFFAVDFGVNKFFDRIKILDEGKRYVVNLTLSAGILGFISLYLISAKALWFNWFTPFAFYQSVAFLVYIKNKIIYYYDKVKRIKK